MTAHWGVPDPAAFEGSDEERAPVFMSTAVTLKRRIEAASKYIGLDQLCLSPQCGFSSTVEGNLLSYDDEVAKLRLIVETAEEVWG